MYSDLLIKIEQLLRTGQYADAEKQLREILAKSPDDWQAQMLFGTCRLFQGDMEGAEKIHRMLEQHYTEFSNIVPAEKTFWEKYHNWIIYGTIAGGLLVLAGPATAVVKSAINTIKEAKKMAEVRSDSTVKYAGAAYYDYKRSLGNKTE